MYVSLRNKITFSGWGICQRTEEFMFLYVLDMREILRTDYGYFLEVDLRFLLKTLINSLSIYLHQARQNHRRAHHFNKKLF